MGEEKFYIDYKHLSILLSKFLQLKALLRNLQLEFEGLTTKADASNAEGAITEDEILYTLSIGNRILTDMPHSQPEPGAKMTNIIIRKDILAQTLPRELMQVIYTIGEVVEKITVALNGLTDKERAIIERRDIQGEDWKEITEKLALGADRLGQIRRDALEKMARTTRVTFEQYEFCIERLRKGREAITNDKH